MIKYARQSVALGRDRRCIGAHERVAVEVDAPVDERRDTLEDQISTEIVVIQHRTSEPGLPGGGKRGRRRYGGVLMSVAVQRRSCGCRADKQHDPGSARSDATPLP